MTEPTNARPVGPHPGDEPLGNPISRWLAVLTSLLLIALAGIGARDLWYNYYENETPSDSWLGRTFEFLGTFTSEIAAVVIACLLILLGLWLIVVSFLRRPRRFVRVNSPVSIWTRPVDVARKSTRTVHGDLGGEHVRSKATRKVVKVEVVDDGSGPALQERIIRSLNNELKSLANPPAVSVKMMPKQTPQQAQPAAQPQAQPAGARPEQHTMEVPR